MIHEDEGHVAVLINHIGKFVKLVASFNVMGPPQPLLKNATS